MHQWRSLGLILFIILLFSFQGSVHAEAVVDSGMSLSTNESTTYDSSPLDQSPEQTQSSGTMLSGVDVSEWNDTINWDSLKASVDFAFMRASYGRYSVDAQFTRNQSEARRVGILMGYYHYSYPQYNEPEDEADHLVDTVGTLRPGEILCLDFEEDTDKDVVDWCIRFLDRVYARTSIKPVIYINASQESYYDWSTVISGGYGLWLARWDGLLDFGTPAITWPFMAFKQYSASGNVAGLNPVDMDIFNGGRSQFLAYGAPGANHTVTPSAGANGTISPNTAQTVAYGSNLTFNAVPNAGYAMGVWSVDGVAVQTGGRTYTLSSIVADHTVSVTFIVFKPKVTPSAGANGTISPSAAQTVTYGSSLTLTATPNAGYAVGVWSVDGTAVRTGGTTYTLSNIVGSHTVSVTFVVFKPTVTPSAGANGTVSPSTATAVTYGSSLTLAATPNTGYTVDAWSVDGVSAQTGGTSYTLSNITANHTVAVTFKVAPTYTVTPSVGANGTLSPNTAQTVSSGSSMVFSAVPNTGYAMGIWSVDGTTVQTGGRTYTLSNITANHTVAVTFIVFTPKITPSAGANGSISPSTAQTVTYGSSLTLTATPNSGYTVNAWSVDGVSVQTGGTTYTLSNIIGSHSVSVTFKAASNFTVTPSVGANGTLTPNTAQTVNSGSSLVFSAVPNTGYAMGVWSVDGTTVQTGGRTYTLSNITANHTVAVTFIVFTPKITPSAGANGSISPSTAQTVTYGSSLTLTATPNSGYAVNAWSVDGVSVQTGGATYTLSNIVGSHSVSVTFKAASNFTVTPSVGANGTLTPNTAQTVSSGSSLVFSAVPNTGYAMGVWSVDGTTVQTGGRTYTLSNITANHTVAVTFIVFTPKITPSAGANGSISPSTAQTVTYGSSLTLTATPNSGYTVNTWSVDGTSVQTGGTTYTLSNIIGSHTVSVTFKAASNFTVTPSVGANGTLTPNTAQTVNAGSSLVFSAVPNTGYAMGVWTVDGTTVQTGGRTYTLSNITANHTVAVTFIVFTPKITPSAGANGTISPSTAQTVTYGSSLTLTATPNTGYTVNAWSVDGASVQTGGTTYTLSNIIGSHTVSVTFK